MKNPLERLLAHFGKEPSEPPDQVVEGFLRVLEQVRVEDMPCSQVFALLDEYVEKEVRGEEAARLMPLLREHFDICPNCCEEYEALLRALEENSVARRETGGK